MDSSLRLEQLGFAVRVDATKIALSIFYLGKEAWNFCESKLIPKNLMEVLGPVVLSNCLRDGPGRVCRKCWRGSNRFSLITCQIF